MLFDEALRHVLKSEGGYVNNPADPGGATNYGIIQKTYNAYLKSKGRPAQHVRAITMAEVGEIYERDYWKPSKCDALPPALRLVHFDCAVNCGVVTAAKLLQEAIGTAVDGKIGPATIAAAEAADVRVSVENYLWLRARYYARISERNHALRQFIAGWIFRLIRVRHDSR